MLHSPKPRFQMVRDLRQLWQIMGEDPAIADELPIVRRLSVRTLVYLLFTEFYLVAQVYPVKWFIDEIGKPQPSVAKLMGIAASMVVMYKLGAELRRFTASARSAALWRMWRVWWGYGHRRELRLSSDWHTAHSTGEKDSMVGKNIYKFEVLVDEVLFNTLPISLRILFTTGLMFFIGWPYGVVSLLTIVVFAAVLRHSEVKLRPQRREAREMLRPIEEFGNEMTNNWRTLKSLGMEEEFSDRNDAMLMTQVEAEKRRHRKAMRYLIYQDDVTTVFRGVLYASIGLTVLWQKPSLGLVVLATTWMERSFSNFVRFADFQRAMNEGMESLRELVELMLLPPTVQMAEQPIEPVRHEGCVIFDHVNFGYTDSRDLALHDICLKVEPFTATALVGPSGGGKSTLMNLLQREHDPSAGCILVDGVNLRDHDYYRYRRETLGVVGQHPQLFSMSIMENIRLGSPEASDTEVIAAARLACAHEFIEAKPGGYQAMIGENGINLSGGERQRLAIARALVRKPKILIMDEATSALDALSQHKFQETIDSLIASRTCTIFIIAHRFPTIMSADQVVVLQDGAIAEVGTHEQLARQNGLYARLRDMESRGLM